MANNYKVKNFSNSTTNTSQVLFEASASTTLVKSIIVNCDKVTPNAVATLKIKKSGGAEELIRRVTVTSRDVSTELLYDVLPLESGDKLYATSDDTDLNFMMSWVENNNGIIGAALDSLTDVDTTGVANGNVLTYNSTSGNWEAEAPAAAGDIFKTIAVAGQSSIVADSTTDTLTIAAGTGITLTTDASTDTLTITNSATGANAFGNVAVAGQTTVAADGTNDTLTLVAGTGVTITTDATTDSVTITNSVTAPNSFDTIIVAGQSSVVAESSSDTLALVAAGGMTITTNATTDTITLDSARLDDDDVTLSGVREIDLNGENLNIVNGAYEILMVEADGVRQANTVIADHAGSAGGKITLAEASVNGVHSIAIQAPASLAASTTYTLPSADGTSGQVLATNATGGLSWTTRAANSFETIAVAGQSSIVADTHTDTLTIAAGSGITLTTDASTDTLTITNSSTAPNTFGTIAVAGQSNVVADSTTDTLTLVAGSNITLTTDATTDTITIAASGGGTPAGSTGQIQYNNAGAFGAEAALFYDATNNRLSVGGNTSPTGTVTSRGAGTTTGSTLLCEDSGGAARFTVYDRGTMFTNERSDVAANVHSFVFNATKDQYWRPTIAFKNSTFSTAIAAWLGDTNTLGYFGTLGGTAATGGLGLYGASSGASASNPTWQMQGFHGSTAPTEAIIRLVGTKYSGSGSGSAMLAALADSEIILKVINSGTATGALTRTTILGSGAMGLRNDAPTSSTSLTVRGHGTGTGISLLVENSGGTARFTVRDDGGYAFAGGTVGAAQTGYTTFTNLTTDRTCDANATTVEELADILGTLIVDLKTKGIIAA